MSISGHHRTLAILTLAAALSVGCAGAHVQVEARRSRYALSMSSMVRDQTGYLHDRHTLVKVGTLNAGRTRVGFLYSVATIFSHYDISDEVNAQVAAAGGEAVVDLTISVGDGCEVLNAFPFLNILPIWPGCVPVYVSGDIVRRAAPTP